MRGPRASGRDAERIESANDLTIDDEGRVLLVSSRSRRIARLERHLDPHSHAAGVEEDWRLPAVLVGLDSRRSGDNLVALEPLP